MADTFSFELVSPEKLLFSKPVAMVTVPGGEGEYGILPGHTPMITSISAGVIRIYADNDATVTDQIFVAGGFAEVTPERFTVLADEAIPVSQLNLPALEKQAIELADKIAAASEEPEEVRDALQAQMDVLSIKIQAVT